MSFTDEEAVYLRSQPLARLATASTAGQPDVVPVPCEFDGEGFWVGGSGETFWATRKVRNVEGGQHRVALVVDDLVSFDPFIARSIRMYGTARPPVERNYLRIDPVPSGSWNMAGQPIGDPWYEPRRAVHRRDGLAARASSRPTPGRDRG